MEVLSDDILFYGICYSNYDVAIIFNRLCKRFNKLSKGYGKDRRNIKEYFLECHNMIFGDHKVKMWRVKSTEDNKIIEKYNGNWLIEREIIIYINDNKKFHKYNSWYNNGNKHYQCTYYITKDKRGCNFKDYEGENHIWHENGVKSQECLYKDGMKEGRQIQWYENGNKKEECTYKDGDLDGKYELWHDNEVKAIECTYKDGDLDGKYMSWYCNKNKKTYCKYVGGIVCGKYKSWYFNGNKLERFRTNEIGRHHGKYQSWFENGGKNEKCTYKNGKYHGLYESWHGSTIYQNAGTGPRNKVRYYKNGNKIKKMHHK